VPLLFAFELLQGIAAPLLALAGLIGLGLAPAWSVAALVAGWYATEVWLARTAGWPMGWRDLAALPLRDALLPALWLATFRSRDISWRGTRVAPAGTARGP
jgi:ceramide glucosyltransferase